MRFGTLLAIAALSTLPLVAQNPARVQHVAVTGSADVVEVEVELSGPVTPMSQMLSAPDRIVVDFPGALPASGLRAQAVNRGALKAVRTGLFSANPPVTRVVLDLESPQTYQVFTTPHSILLKLSALPGAGGKISEAASVSGATNPAEPTKPAMEVTFRDGMLRIRAERVTLAQVLFEVQRQTGAEIAIPAGAETEQIVADLGPAPAREVLASLLNGSRYNFVFIDNEHSHTLQKAILSVR